MQKICEKPQVVNEYENGKAIPNQAVLSKLERALGKIWSWLPSFVDRTTKKQSEPAHLRQGNVVC